MRKDAKIGFAVGGVLLAVLTVYTITTRKKAVSPNGVSLITPRGESSASAGRSAPAGRAPEAVTLAPGNDTPQAPSTENTPDPKPDALAKGSDNVNWARLLSGSGEAPTLMSATPPAGEPKAPEPATPPSHEATVANRTSPPAEETARASDASGSPQAPLLIGTTSVPAGTSLTNPSTRPVVGRAYLVKPSQTLSSIAAEVYGNQRFYVAILRANPGLDAARLRPGMRITLPDISDVRPDMHAPVAAEKNLTSVRSNEKHTYKVESGDNLYRISKKLFGSPKLADAIYKLNESEIGPDKARLKLGMLLKLPQAPTAAATASRN